MRELIFRCLLLAGLFCLTSCTLSFSNLEYNRGEDALKAKKYNSAVAHFKKVIERQPDSPLALKAAREASRVAYYDTKNYLQAVDFYRQIVDFSRDEKERREAQRSIADIYFDNLTNYPKAIEEYNRLLFIEKNPHQIVRYRFNLARAHFYLNQFDDSKNDIDAALKLAQSPDRKFDLKMFLASIYFNTKKLDKALAIYGELEHDYPKRAKAENIAINESVCYEEQEAFDKAIAKLESIESTYKDPEFIALKIKRLKERKANMPGARGLRR